MSVNRSSEMGEDAHHRSWMIHGQLALSLLQGLPSIHQDVTGLTNHEQSTPLKIKVYASSKIDLWLPGYNIYILNNW